VLLTERFIAVQMTGARAWAKPGTVLSRNATMRAGWTDEPPVKP